MLTCASLQAQNVVGELSAPADTVASVATTEHILFEGLEVKGDIYDFSAAIQKRGFTLSKRLGNENAYIFKGTVWNRFRAETELDYPSLYHFRHKLVGYEIICNQIRQVLVADKELTAKHDAYYVSEKYKDHSDYHLMTQDFLYSISEHFNGFDRLPVHWEEDKDVYTDEIANYLKKH